MGANENGYQKKILIAGNSNLAFSISVCMLQAGHTLILYTENEVNAWKSINTHLYDLQEMANLAFDPSLAQVVTHLGYGIECDLAIAITNEDLDEKQQIIRALEKAIPSEVMIAINSDCIPLCSLQEHAMHPQRIIAANWVEPAHTTYFLELIINEKNDRSQIDDLNRYAMEHWKKDGYIITSEISIRTRMLCAMVREAFYLVENGYASIDDIDRACRNDAGYYLPFAGNFRYIDLMGTSGYGRVMKDLYPTLSKASEIPDFFKSMVANGSLGMQNNKGLYNYRDADVERWNEIIRKFSYQVHHIISKYPFNYMEENLDGKINNG